MSSSEEIQNEINQDVQNVADAQAAEAAQSSIERQQFSQRLEKALANAKYPSDSPTQLSREFNVRFSGRAITVHAARKWLIAEAIPTQEKLRALAEWLGVTADWLRFGGEHTQTDATPRYESEDVKLIADLQRLDDHHKVIAREMIRTLVRLNCN